MEKNFVTLVMEMSLEELRNALRSIASTMDDGEMPTCFELYNIFKGEQK